MLNNVAQTINGITVTVHWTYADTERVLVGYTIQGSRDVIYEPRQVLLSTTDGQVFSEQGGSGVVGSDELLGIIAPRNFGTFLPQFDQLDHQSGLPRSVHLTLQVEERVDAVSPPPSSLLDRLRSFFQPPRDTRAIAQPAIPGPQTGPFSFEFELSSQ
jgi:hypothetical protein